MGSIWKLTSTVSSAGTVKLVRIETWTVPSSSLTTASPLTMLTTGFGGIAAPPTCEIWIALILGFSNS